MRFRVHSKNAHFNLERIQMIKKLTSINKYYTIARISRVHRQFAHNQFLIAESSELKHLNN